MVCCTFVNLRFEDRRGPLNQIRPNVSKIFPCENIWKNLTLIVHYFRLWYTNFVAATLISYLGSCFRIFALAAMICLPSCGIGLLLGPNCNNSYAKASLAIEGNKIGVVPCFDHSSVLGTIFFSFLLIFDENVICAGWWGGHNLLVFIFFAWSLLYQLQSQGGFIKISLVYPFHHYFAWDGTRTTYA